MTLYKTYRECPACHGAGTVSNPGLPDTVCSTCIGRGKYEQMDIDLGGLESKIDAIKAMLDSPILGMQKMSSNLDDIMVKLDV